MFAKIKIKEKKKEKTLVVKTEDQKIQVYHWVGSAIPSGVVMRDAQNIGKVLTALGYTVEVSDEITSGEDE